MPHIIAKEYFDIELTVEGKPFAVEFFVADRVTKQKSDSDSHWEYYPKLCDAIKTVKTFNEVMEKLNR